MESFRSDVTEQYERMGSVYITMQKQASTAPRYERDWCTNHIMQQFGSFHSKVVVDVGCGSGGGCKKYSEAGASVVYGIDPSQYMLDEARKLNPDEELVSLRLGTYDKLPLSDGIADGLIGFYSLHYSHNLSDSYREIARVLKPGGRVVIIIPHPHLSGKSKKSQYHEPEVIEISIYNGTCTLRHPHHDFCDYFSPAFFALFNLEFLDEYFPELEDGREQKDPEQCCFVATKKLSH